MLVLSATSFKASQLCLDANKPTILVISDSPCIHTGHAQIVRNIWNRIFNEGKYNIVQLAWWHTNPLIPVPWPLLVTSRNPQNILDPADNYGDCSLNNILRELKPNLCWMMGDPWMLYPVASRRSLIQCPIMSYIPADGGPLDNQPVEDLVSSRWSEVVNASDVVVPMLPTASKLMKAMFPDGNIYDPIPAGVDLNMYSPVCDEERAEIKKRIFGFNNRLIMGSVSRNQQRKHLAVNIQAVHFLSTGKYSICSKCGKYNLWDRNYMEARDIGPVSKCRYCGGSVKPGKPIDVAYYMHTPLIEGVDDQYRIIPLVRQFGLEFPQDGIRKIFVNQQIQPMHGMAESIMVDYYRAMDVFALPSLGEGFGLPLLEAMACGTPVVVPDYSCPPDFISGAVVQCSYIWCEPPMNYWRGMVDPNLWAQAIVETGSPDARIRARKRAEEFGWDTTIVKWAELIEHCLKNGRSIRFWNTTLKGV